MATKKVEKEEDQMYRKMCDNSNYCSEEKGTSVQGNMEIYFCQQCFHILSWKKIEVESKTPVQKVKKENPVKEEKEVVSSIDQATVDIADEMQAAFADVDQVMNDITKIGAKPAPVEDDLKVVSEEEEFDPFAEEENEPMESDFVILKVKEEKSNTIRLICEAQGSNSRWLIDKETEPSKVKMIMQKPELVTDKLLRIKYDRLDEVGRPVNPQYITLVPKK